MDGIYINEFDILLVLCYVDCVLFYFYVFDYYLVGLVYVGWKGIVKDIVGNMIWCWVE